MTLRHRFLELSPRERRLVHDRLVERALAAWTAYTATRGEIRYRETVVGTEQVVDVTLPEDAVRAVHSGQGIAQVHERYGEPIAALQDDDLSFPDPIQFAYYAVLNYFRKYALERDVDDWVIANQAVSSEADETKWEGLLKTAIEAASVADR